MIIVPAFCSQSYSYNARVEEAVAKYISNITGLACYDFSGGARPEYDFLIGMTDPIKVELKTTGSKYVPVETHVDEKQTIEGGLLKSEADIVIAISMGMRSNYDGEVGKLRVWKRKSLIRDAVKYGRGKYYPPGPTSPGSYTYSFQPNKENFHIWLGDIPVIYQQTSSWNTTVPGYDFDSIFDDSKIGAEQLEELINDMRELNFAKS